REMGMEASAAGARDTTEAGPKRQLEPGAVQEAVVEPHADHAGRKPGRVVAIALDSSKYSEHGITSCIQPPRKQANRLQIFTTAFNWAIEHLISPCTDNVVLLNVRPHPGPMTSIGDLYDADLMSSYAALEEHHRRESHDLLRAYAAKLPKGKYNVRGVALRGDPREEIADKVDNLGADVLVVGSRGLGPFKRALLGSVSDYLVHHVGCAVVVPKMSEEEKIKAH
ncbi:hypothetical protein HK101_005114, partial [Irineochytrium annulatum]